MSGIIWAFTVNKYSVIVFMFIQFENDVMIQSRPFNRHLKAINFPSETKWKIHGFFALVDFCFKILDSVKGNIQL